MTTSAFASSVLYLSTEACEGGVVFLMESVQLQDAAPKKKRKILIGTIVCIRETCKQNILAELSSDALSLNYRLNYASKKSALPDVQLVHHGYKISASF